MPEWAEGDLKSYSSMQAAREVGKKFEERRTKTHTNVEQLEKNYNNFEIAEAIVSVIPKMLEKNKLPAE